MSQNTENELVIEIDTKVDFTELDLLKKKLTELKEAGEVRAGKLAASGFGPLTKGQDSSSAQSTRKDEEVISLLKDLKVNSQEFIDVTKKEWGVANNTTKKSDSDRKQKDFPFPFAQNPLSSAGSAAGGAIGGIAGLAIGSPLIGAQIGSMIGDLFSKVVGTVKAKVEELVPMLDNRISEDMHFRQLNYQTGMSVDKLYKLQKQAELAGTSLDTIIDSNQRFADELMGGLSQEKTQLLMALNVDPRDLLLKSGGNLANTNQKVYEAVNKAYKGQDPAIRTSMLRRLGYGDEEADARRFIYQKDVKQRAEKVYDVATNGGKNPFHTGQQLQSEILNFKGSQMDLGAAVRSALTTNNIAQNLSTKLMDVKAEVVKLVVQGANLLFDKTESTSEAVSTQNSRKIDTVNQTTNDNSNMRQKIMDQLNSRNSGKPASTSAISKVTGG